MTKSGLDRMDSGTVCTARRRNGTQCLNYAMKGAKVCRMHGGSAPQVRRAAQVRLLMQADNLMAALLKIALDDKQPVAARLVAIRDGLDRADLSGKQTVELTVEKGRTFEDVTADVVMDLDMGDDEDNIEDAVVIEDDDTGPLVPREEAPLQNRHDRKAFAEVQRARSAPRPASKDRAALMRAEAEALARVAGTDDVGQRTLTAGMGRDAYLIALDNGASHDEAEAAARAAVEHGGRPQERRRTRVTEATMTTGSTRKRRR